MVRVIIVDNEETFRKGLKAVLMHIGNADVVAEAGNGIEFLALLAHTSADVVFMDIKMPLMNGIEATRKAKQMYPDLSIFGFSSYENRDYINSMLEAGACGYLSKSGDNYNLLSEILNNPKPGYFSGLK